MSTADSTEDTEIDSFFKELETAGVLSTDALKELREDYKAEASSSGKLAVEKKELTEAEQAEKDLRAQIAEMSVAEKIKLALLGDSICRALLIQDTSRLIQQAVLGNPRLQIGEVEAMAKNSNVSEFVLRTISSNRNWVKSYIVKFNLVSNPKCPNDVGLKWLRYMNKNDLRKLAKSKNIPQLIAVSAKRHLAEMQ